MQLDKLIKIIVTIITVTRIVDIVCFEGLVKYCSDEIAVLIENLVGTRPRIYRLLQVQCDF